MSTVYSIDEYLLASHFDLCRADACLPPLSFYDVQYSIIKYLNFIPSHTRSDSGIKSVVDLFNNSISVMNGVFCHPFASLGRHPMAVGNLINSFFQQTNKLRRLRRS
jgi:hypothetical protein